MANVESDDEPWHGQADDSGSSDDEEGANTDSLGNAKQGPPNTKAQARRKGAKGKSEDISLPEEFDDKASKVDELPPHLWNEALLSVQSIAVMDNETNEWVKTEDSAEFLRDLHQAMNHENEISDARHISSLLVNWKTLQNILIPVMINSNRDPNFDLSELKIFFLLTKALPKSVTKDVSAVIDPKNESEGNRTLRLARKRRAERQFHDLRVFKACFVNAEFIEVLVGMFQEAINTNLTRTHDQSLIIELVLGFIRNLLAIPDANPANASATGSSATASSKQIFVLGEAENTQEKLITALHEGEMLNLVLSLCEDVENRENKVLNLLLMEICHFMTLGQDVKLVAAAIKKLENAAAKEAKQLAKEEDEGDGEGAAGVDGHKMLLLGEEDDDDDTSLVVVAIPEESSSSSSSSKQSSKSKKTAASAGASSSRSQRRTPTEGGGGGGGGGMTLMQRLQAERASASSSALRQGAGSRHTHFGGLLKLAPNSSSSTGGSGGGKSTARVASFASNAFRAQNDAAGCVPKAMAKRDKKKLVFHSSAAGLERSRVTRGGDNKGAVAALAFFCKTFFEEAYAPFMKNVKKEFRIESSRLDIDVDMVKYLDLSRFFFSLRREWRPVTVSPPPSSSSTSTSTSTAAAETIEGGEEAGGGEKAVAIAAAAAAEDGADEEAAEAAAKAKAAAMKKSIDVQLVSASMDIFSFNMLHSTIDRWIAEKKWGPLEHATALLLEMISMLCWMRTVTSVSELRLISVHLMGNIYFSADSTDKLGALLRAWQPALFSKAHLSNLAELGHLTYKLFDNRRSTDSLPQNKAMSERLFEANLFDSHNHLNKNFATSHVVRLHRLLLGYYASNPPAINHACVSFFHRLCSTYLPMDEEALYSPHDHLDFPDEDGDELAGGAQKKKKGKKSPYQPSIQRLSTATYEPLLYNLPFLEFCEKVLSDPSVQGSQTKQAFAAVRVLCETVVRHFGALASSNPVLYADAVFTQPHFQRVKFCRQAPLHYADQGLIDAMKQNKSTRAWAGNDEPSSSSSTSTNAGGGGAEGDDDGVPHRATTRASLSASKKKTTADGDDHREEGTAAAAAGGGGGSSSSSSGEMGARSAMTTAMLAMEEEEEEEFDFGADDDDDTFGLAAAAPKGSSKRRTKKSSSKKKDRKRKESSSSGGGRKSSKSSRSGGGWTAEEDEVVVRMFGLHSGDSSMVHLLTEELSEFGAAAWDPLQARTNEAVVQRLRDLKLIGKDEVVAGMVDDDDDDDNDDENDEDEVVDSKGGDDEDEAGGDKAEDDGDDNDAGSDDEANITADVEESEVVSFEGAATEIAATGAEMADDDDEKEGEEATPETIPQIADAAVESEAEAKEIAPAKKSKKGKAGKRLQKKSHSENGGRGGQDGGASQASTDTATTTTTSVVATSDELVDSDDE